MAEKRGFQFRIEKQSNKHAAEQSEIVGSFGFTLLQTMFRNIFKVA